MIAIMRFFQIEDRRRGYGGPPHDPCFGDMDVSEIHIHTKPPICGVLLLFFGGGGGGGGGGGC